MWTIASGDPQGLADCGELIAALNALPKHWDPELRALFDPEREVIVCRAPGRLDVMGGIADYSGSLVLQLPLAAAAYCAVQPRADRRFRVFSVGPEQLRVISVDLDQDGAAVLHGYDAARQFFAKRETWAAYVLGVLTVWSEKLDLQPVHGADVLIRSDVPEGAGAASSAAIEVASAQALAGALGVERQPLELALDCQRAENLVAGAPCGVMDQMTAVCGEADRLLKLLCQPARIEGHLDLPPELSLWGIDSGVNHSVAGEDYKLVRAAAFMGHRILAERLGCRIEKAGTRIKIPNDPWNGYLANVPVPRFNRQLSKLLPEEMTGSAFLQRYAGTIDEVTSIDPRRVYPVRAATAHPVHESQRVHAFAEQLERVAEAEAPKFLGRLMYDSHESYTSCGLGSSETDLLIELAKRAGPVVHGAKITGGGSGGTVAILGRSDAEETIRQIAAEYGQRSGRIARILSGSSMGASSFGTLRLRRG